MAKLFEAVAVTDVDRKFLRGRESGRLSLREKGHSCGLVDVRRKCENVDGRDWRPLGNKPGCFSQHGEELANALPLF